MAFRLNYFVKEKVYDQEGTSISNLLSGESIIDVYNQMGHKAAVTNNHEFEWGLDVPQDRMAQADFPILAANIFIEGTDDRPDWVAPATMLSIKGEHISLIGATSKDTPSIVMAGVT